MKMKAKGKKSEDGMMTPSNIYKQLDHVFNFTHDIACTTKNCLSPFGVFYDKKDDALKQSWASWRCFCNPPFSGKADWIRKAHEEVQNGGCPIVVMVLPKNSMDSPPWHDYIYGRYHYQIIKGRVSFIDPKTKKPKKGNNSGTTIVFFMKKVVR